MPTVSGIRLAMTSAMHRNLFWVESVLITLPMFVHVCYVGTLGIAFGMTVVFTSGLIGLALILVAAVGIVGTMSLTHLSIVYLSRGIEALQQSSRWAWITTTLGAALALLAVLTWAIFSGLRRHYYDQSLSALIVFVPALVGAPLMVPFLHLRYLRGLQRSLEAIP